MLGQVFDKLDSWLGRAFILSCFVPCLMFLVLNLGLACVEVPGLQSWLTGQQAKADSFGAYGSLLVLVGVAAFSFALSPGLRFVTALLEGRSLPVWIAEPLLLQQAMDREALMSQGQAVEARRSRLPRREAVEQLLREARGLGRDLGCLGDRAAILLADAEIERLRRFRTLNRPIDSGMFLCALASLCAALRSNCADLEQLAIPITWDDMRAAEMLDRLHIEVFGVFAPYVIDIADRSEAREWERRSRLFAVSELAATRLGNEAAELRSYCLTRYGFDFEFIWPRLQLVIQKDEKLSSAIVRSKIQVDFSIVCLSLTVLSGIGWMLELLYCGQNVTTVLIVASVVPGMAYGWLKIVHTTYADFSQLVRSAIDLTRRDLLSQLSLQPPATLADERQVWQTVARWLVFDEEPEKLEFQRSTPT